MLNKPASGVLALRVGSTYPNRTPRLRALRPFRTGLLSILPERTHGKPEGHNR